MKKISGKGTKKLNVLFAASEAAPFAKTGGLADVAGTLPLALGKLGVRVALLMPRYRGVPAGPQTLAPGVTAHFIENEAYFNRASLYGHDKGDYPDNLERFNFFCNEALRWAKEEGFRPDVVHAHDWQTALLPVLLKTRYAQEAFFKNTRTFLTVHNLAYQGQFPARMFPQLGLNPSLFGMDGFEFYGKINLMKAGLLYADAIGTVSPTYAKEMQTKDFGFGLEGVVKKRASDLHGILNGLDYSVWDPARDKAIAQNYSAASPAGKASCKADLQKACGLPVEPGTPVFGIVSRFAEQKGLDLLSEICDRLLALKVQFVMLGDGDAVYRTTFANVAKRHPKNASVNIGFHAAEAHKIYAGADFFLMPSYFEPCGLGQLISLKYGTVPVVRQTGGLADTITDADENPLAGNGFVFKDHSPESFFRAIERALKAYADPKRLSKLRADGMRADFSWNRSASAYEALYRTIAPRPALGEAA